MGRATRWFKGLLGMKKDKDRASSSSSVSGADEKLEKRRWSVGKSAKDLIDQDPKLGKFPSPNVDPAWLRSYIADNENEQNKHAIAVAAATAAAADAAVAAAQAAVAVVRLTSQGRGARLSATGGGSGDRWAAVKIQTVFRGYLARKALRALKGLVKLQALVRGYLVRKRAAATLHSMQALIRAQAAARSQRARRSINKENRYYPENRPRRSIERFDETRSEFHSKRLSASYEPPMNGTEESPKIVEIDTFKPRSRSRRMNNVLVECGEEFPYYHSVSSPIPCAMPARLSIPDSRHLQDFDWCLTGDECRFSTAQSTPRFMNSVRSNAPPTPAKSVCGDSFFRPYNPNFPSYMANTQSFNAKLRSHSAPKQRPEPVGPRKRLSLHEIMAARNSMSGVRMQRSCNHLHEVLNY